MKNNSIPQSVLKHTIYFQSKEITQRGKVYKLQTKLLEFVDPITCTVRVVSSYNSPVEIGLHPEQNLKKADFGVIR